MSLCAMQFCLFLEFRCDSKRIAKNIIFDSLRIRNEEKETCLKKKLFLVLAYAFKTF
jgi:hypothetical protein